MELTRFTRGAPRFLQVGFAGFARGILGVTLTFGAQAVSSSLVQHIGFGVTVLGVSIGLIALLGGLVQIAKRGLSSPSGGDLGSPKNETGLIK